MGVNERKAINEGTEGRGGKVKIRHNRVEKIVKMRQFIEGIEGQGRVGGVKKCNKHLKASFGRIPV